MKKLIFIVLSSILLFGCVESQSHQTDNEQLENIERFEFDDSNPLDQNYYSVVANNNILKRDVDYLAYEISHGVRHVFFNDFQVYAFMDHFHPELNNQRLDKVFSYFDDSTENWEVTEDSYEFSNANITVHIYKSYIAMYPTAGAMHFMNTLDQKKHQGIFPAEPR